MRYGDGVEPNVSALWCVDSACGAALFAVCGEDVEGDSPQAAPVKPRSEFVQMMEEVLIAAPLPLLLGLAGLLICSLIYGFGATVMRVLVYLGGLF